MKWLEENGAVLRGEEEGGDLAERGGEGGGEKEIGELRRKKSSFYSFFGGCVEDSRAPGRRRWSSQLNVGSPCNTLLT